MASVKPFNYHSGSWIILSQTCSKLRHDSSEDFEVNNRLEKMHFADLVKDSKSVAGFLLPTNFNDGMTSRKNGLAAKCSFKMAASKVASFETNFVRIAGSSEAEASVE